MFKSLIVYLALALGSFVWVVSNPFNVTAQDRIEDTLEAVVTKIVDEKVILPEGGVQEQKYQKLELLVSNGSLVGQTITVENGLFPVVDQQKYKIGDKLIINYGQDLEGNQNFIITDFVRRDSLVWLFVIFIAAVILVGRWHGISSLLGMGISFLVIFKYILPQIAVGQDPVLIAIIGSMLIVPITFYMSHGLNKKTSVAIAGTVITLVFTGILAAIFVSAARLTGFAAEEAAFLQAVSPGLINMRGLLLAGIIIGALGVFDDITISQAAIVAQLKDTNTKLKFTDLYRRAMNVGHDHIASMVNTLVLVYTGAALPLLLLFIDSTRSFSEVINYELIADEIVRTLVASTGLILAVPVTTFLAALVFSSQKSK